MEKKGQGKSYNKRIKFDEGLIGKEMSDYDKNMEEMKMLEEYGEDDSIIRVNPELFSRFKYLATADAEEMFAKNSDYWQPVLLNLKTALASDPYTNQEELTRRLHYSYFKGESDDLMQKPEQAQPMTETNANPMGEMIKAKQNSNVANEVVI